MTTQTNQSLFGDVIYAYTRKQALEDGELVDVSETAREAGIKFPVAMTRELYHGTIEPDAKATERGESLSGRLWDALFMLRIAIGKARGSHIAYEALFTFNGRRKLVKMNAVCGPGDDAEPVITLMLPSES